MDGEDISRIPLTTRAVRWHCEIVGVVVFTGGFDALVEGLVVIVHTPNPGVDDGANSDESANNGDDESERGSVYAPESSASDDDSSDDDEADEEDSDEDHEAEAAAGGRFFFLHHSYILSYNISIHWRRRRKNKWKEDEMEEEVK